MHEYNHKHVLHIDRQELTVFNRLNTFLLHYPNGASKKRKIQLQGGIP